MHWRTSLQAPRKRSLADILDPGAPGPQQPSKTSTSVQSALMASTLVALTEDQITRIAAQQLLATMPPAGPGMASALPLAAAPWSLQGDELAGARLAPVGLVIPVSASVGGAGCVDCLQQLALESWTLRARRLW